MMYNGIALTVSKQADFENAFSGKNGYDLYHDMMAGACKWYDRETKTVIVKDTMGNWQSWTYAAFIEELEQLYEDCKYWYAVQTNDDDDAGYGSEDWKEALRLAKMEAENPDNYKVIIATYDEDDCVAEEVIKDETIIDTVDGRIVSKNQVEMYLFEELTARGSDRDITEPEASCILGDIASDKYDFAFDELRDEIIAKVIKEWFEVK